MPTEELIVLAEEKDIRYLVFLNLSLIVNIKAGSLYMMSVNKLLYKF